MERTAHRRGRRRTSVDSALGSQLSTIGMSYSPEQHCTKNKITKSAAMPTTEPRNQIQNYKTHLIGEANRTISLAQTYPKIYS